MKKNQLTTTKSTALTLGKTKSLMSITKKLLEGKGRDLAVHKDVTIIGDLMWENVPNPEEHMMNWDDAMAYAKNLRLGGYDDWRLPTREELKLVLTLAINSTNEIQYFPDYFSTVVEANYPITTTSTQNYNDYYYTGNITGYIGNITETDSSGSHPRYYESYSKNPTKAWCVRMGKQ